MIPTFLYHPSSIPIPFFSSPFLATLPSLLSAQHPYHNRLTRLPSVFDWFGKKGKGRVSYRSNEFHTENLFTRISRAVAPARRKYSLYVKARPGSSSLWSNHRRLFPVSTAATFSNGGRRSHPQLRSIPAAFSRLAVSHAKFLRIRPRWIRISWENNIWNVTGRLATLVSGRKLLLRSAWMKMLFVVFVGHLFARRGLYSKGRWIGFVEYKGLDYQL